MCAYFTACNVAADVEVMRLKAVHQTVLRLSYILGSATFAGNRIDQIRTFASYIEFARVGSARGGAKHFAFCV